MDGLAGRKGVIRLERVGGRDYPMAVGAWAGRVAGQLSALSRGLLYGLLQGPAYQESSEDARWGAPLWRPVHWVPKEQDARQQVACPVWLEVLVEDVKSPRAGPRQGARALELE